MTTKVSEELEEIIKDAYNSGWLDCREGGDYYSKHAPNNNKELIARIQNLINNAYKRGFLNGGKHELWAVEPEEDGMVYTASSIAKRVKERKALLYEVDLQEETDD